MLGSTPAPWFVSTAFEDAGVCREAHFARRVLDEHDLARAEHVLRDEDAPQRVFCVAARVPDDVRISEIDAECCGRVDASIHAGH